MDNIYLDLIYLKAKEDLANFINSMPNKYGLSFIFIDEMLNDLKAQVKLAAINDRKNLESMLKNSKEENKNNE